MSNREEIALLEYPYASVLQARLLSTLDRLDALQRTHQEELSIVTAERDQVRVKLHRYIDFVNSVESDRDDLRDAVTKLIEKVKISNNDYTNWPHSQMYLSSLADPSLPKQTLGDARGHENDENSQLLYAASLINILRKQRDEERAAHARTRELADGQLAALNAKLSRRDAELESCIASASEHIIGKTGSSGKERERMGEIGSISRDGIFSFLDARNKTLEAEVKILANRLEHEDARSTRRRRSSSYASTSSTTHPDNALQPVNLKRSLSTAVRPIKFKSLETQINEFGLKIDAFAAERKAIAESVGLAASPEFEPSLISPEEKNLGQPSDELHLRLQTVELECARLRQRETELREQLNDTRMDAREREAELLAEIDVLRRNLPETTLSLRYAEVATETEPPGSFSPLPPANQPNLLEPNEGEQSMELATPLMPTSVLSTVPEDADLSAPSLRNQSPSRNFNPQTISSPRSPELDLEGLSAWEDNSPSDFSIFASDFPIPPRFTTPPRPSKR